MLARLVKVEELAVGLFAQLAADWPVTLGHQQEQNTARQPDVAQENAVCLASTSGILTDREKE